MTENENNIGQNDFFELMSKQVEGEFEKTLLELAIKYRSEETDKLIDKIIELEKSNND